MSWKFEVTPKNAVVYNKQGRPILKIDSISNVTVTNESVMSPVYEDLVAAIDMTRDKEVTFTCDNVSVCGKATAEKQEQYRIMFDDEREDKYYE